MILILSLSFLSYRFLIGPFIEQEREIKELLLSRQRLLTKYQAFISQEKTIDERLKRLRKALEELEPRLFSAKTTSLAAAELQDILKTLSKNNGIDIKSTKVLDTETIEGDYEKIPVQLITESHIAQLVDFLYEIENHKKILLIPKLNIDITNYRNPDKVRATLVIAGFRRLGG